MATESQLQFDPTSFSMIINLLPHSSILVNTFQSKYKTHRSTMAASAQDDDSKCSSKSWSAFRTVHSAEKAKHKSVKNLTTQNLTKQVTKQEKILPSTTWRTEAWTGTRPAIESCRGKCRPRIPYPQGPESQIASQIYSPVYRSHHFQHLKFIKKLN